jgi:adenylylsulfate kinase-like enzyme
VKAGEVKQFTGRDSGFEEPDRPDVVVDTEALDEDASLALLLGAARGKIDFPR